MCILNGSNLNGKRKKHFYCNIQQKKAIYFKNKFNKLSGINHYMIKQNIGVNRTIIGEDHIYSFFYAMVNFI